ncbi:MAG: flagellar FlbD family protein [Oscillospiraceae bacterium]|nr:flagellar FlbD family protein [Oscillospiraceae bacterium]
MIKLTKINGETLYLNPMIIESVNFTPDTVIVLTNGKTMVVSNSIDYIVDEIVKFYNKLKFIPPIGNIKE